MALGLKADQADTIKHPDRYLLDRCLSWAAVPGQAILTLDHPAYPHLLREIPSPPPVLFIRGDLEKLSLPQIAIVGSRHASMEGMRHAGEFAAGFVAADYAVTSGLALGIDGKAHAGALDAGGSTVAVLGSGLDNVYPARHKGLAARIVENGALVSEFWPWAKPRPEFFPRRNRIISGLSTGVLIVEAAEKSGSLITARYAMEQNRDVFALPGPIHSPGCRGTNTLIKNGAFLVDSPEDIVGELGVITQWSRNAHSDLFTTQHMDEELPFSDLLANVGDKATCVDVLAERCDLPVHEVMMQLTDLELLGLVSAVPGGYVRVRRG